ncbi:MAG: hypothetical protein KF835_01835 [Xanthobacteraceae bacterium]|nr:hypothetical protein [Xanthobacteraceae bacterium]
MTDLKRSEIEASGPQAPEGGRESSRDPNVNQPPEERPYGDASNLYEIPRIRPDDPPMRKWWTDDEPQRESGSPE